MCFGHRFGVNGSLFMGSPLLVEGFDVLGTVFCAIFCDDGDCMAVIEILNAVVPC